MSDHITYIKYVLSHKLWVFRACRLLGVPLWIAILHDWDKFTPAEYRGYLKRLTSPGDYDAKLAYALTDPDYNLAWHLHQKRNKHHWQWWCTVKDDGSTKCLKMSAAAQLEMLADWLAMNKLDYDDTADWYVWKSRRNEIQLHPDTKQWVESKLPIYEPHKVDNE